MHCIERNGMIILKILYTEKNCFSCQQYSSLSTQNDQSLLKYCIQLSATFFNILYFLSTHYQMIPLFATIRFSGFNEYI